MQLVTIYIDESADWVCLEHRDCAFAGRTPGDECDPRYFYGVGACVFETKVDHDEMVVRLGRVKQRILVRNGIAGSRKMAKFVQTGWHATEDLPEFADPLVEEVDTDAPFKGHVRFRVTSSPQNVSAVHSRLFVSILAPVLRRYSDADQVRVIFEDSGMKLSEYQGLIDLAGHFPNVAVHTEGKGSDLLALADYLLYATMKYAGRVEQLCDNAAACAISHVVPTSASLQFDDGGVPVAVGHVQADDRWHKMYFAFVRNMSSVVRVG